MTTSVDQFMAKSLALLERIAEGIEALNETGVHITSFTLPEGFDLKAVGNIVHATGTATASVEAEAPNDKASQAKEVSAKGAAATKTSDASSETAASSSAQTTASTEDKPVVEEAPAASTVKRATADEARKALKAYAAIEGNEAAMELLKGLGAGSVTALEEASSDEDDKLAQLIAACK